MSLEMNVHQLTLLLAFLLGLPVYFTYLLGMTAYISYRLAPPPLAPSEYSMVRHLFYTLLFLISLAVLSWCIVCSSLFAQKPDMPSPDFTDIDTGLLIFMIWTPWLPWALGIASVRSNPLWLGRFFQRPKIILFRSFNDRKALAAIFYHFAGVLSVMGRTYALVPLGKLSHRRELRNQVLRLTLPGLNSIRLLTVPDESWQDRVRDLLSDADAVIIDVTNPTESVEWELELALRIAGEERVVLLVQEGYEMGLQFSRIIKYRRPAWLLLLQEPTAVASLRDALLTIIASHGTRASRENS